MKHLYTYFIVAVLGLSGAYAQCTEPVITEVSEGVIACEGSSASLTAVSDSGTLAWFASESGGTQLATGGTYDTPALEEATSYWVEASVTELGTPQTGGGKTTPGNAASSVVAGTSPWGLVFNATEDFILNSVVVYLAANSAGTLVVQLKNSSFDILETVTVSTPPGGSASNPVAFTVPLDFTIEAGTGYRLVAQSSPNMIRDFSSGVSYPYPIGTLGSITQGTIDDGNANSGLYYFFYNWNCTPFVTCTSDRQEVAVTVTPTPGAPEIADQQFCGSGVVAGLLDEENNLLVYSDPTGGQPLEADVPLESGTYYISYIVETCESERAPVEVVIQITPEPESGDQVFCGSATVADLEAEGEDLNWYDDIIGPDVLTGTTELTTGAYYVSQTINGCEGNRKEIIVTVTPTPLMPEGAAQQSFTDGETLNDLIVSGENLTWYSDADGINAIPNTTLLTDGTTYYAAQIVDGCESPLLEVTVTLALSVDGFALSNLRFYPNPVDSKFTIINTHAIDDVDIYNLQGQKISGRSVGSVTAEIDFSSFASGIYIIRVQSGSAVKNIRVSKN